LRGATDTITGRGDPPRRPEPEAHTAVRQFRSGEGLDRSLERCYKKGEGKGKEGQQHNQPGPCGPALNIRAADEPRKGETARQE